ncbi:RagB/SusD family nutrient uptake outer membrane protein [Mucilaginibacter sp. AW1-3]
MKKLITYIAAVLVLILAHSCKLDEVNPSSVTSDKYFVTQDSYEELVNETYRYLRPLLQNTGHMWYGTDMYDRTGVVDDTQMPLNDYTVFTGNESQGWWTDNYNLITKANTALSRGAAIQNVIDPKLYATRTGELLALRAYAYLNLVESFGDVPLLTSEVTDATYNFTRTPEADVYKQMVGDLNQAISQLPADPSDYGRVAQAMAQHLLGKVLLTRSYKSYAQPTDLTGAISALQVAMSKSTLTTWETLFGDQYAVGNKEVIFAVRYSSTDANNKTGNNLYQQFKFWTDRFPGGALAAPYWRQDASYQPTSYVFNLYAANDFRATERFLQRHIVAATAYAAGANGAIKAGDNVIYLPRVAMTPAEITTYLAANKPTYYVVNPDQYHTFFGSNVIYPIIWKFYDPTVVVYTNAGVDPQGHRDTYIFRRAETMMLLAEAYVKQGQGALATGLINELRVRAKLSGTDLLTGSATLSDVLDESARELFGESNRWMDLKRTGTLLTRAAQYNAFTAHNHPTAIDSRYLVRPIPVTEIVRSPTLTQNPGYPGK